MTKVKCRGARLGDAMSYICCGLLSAVLLCGWSQVTYAQQFTGKITKKGYADKRYLRWKHFHEPRAYPNAFIPPNAYANAMGHRLQQIRALTFNGTQAPSINLGAWTPIGPTQITKTVPDSGRLTTIAIHPTDPNTIYAGGAQGGVWKTTNDGATWSPLTDQECSLAMGSIAIDPVAPNIVYAGTGELHFSGDSYYGCGVLRSIDGGTSWQQLGVPNFDTATGGARISKVVVDAATAGSATTTTVFVASDFGLYRSTNSGNSWTRVLNGTITDLVANPSDASILYAAIGSAFGGSANGVYKSTNGGISWSKQAGGLPTTSVGRINLAIAPSQPSTVLASIQSTSNFQLLGIYRTTNAGTTWSQLSATGASCSSQCWYDMHIQVHPTNPNTIYFGGVLLYRSTDAGASFSNITGGIHVDQHAWAFHPTNPSIVYAGNDGGIYKSTNGGTTWTSLNTNIAITQFYASIALHPTDGNVILGGTQDNHTLAYNGTTWTPVNFPGVRCDGGGVAIDHANPQYMYGQCQWSQGASFSGPRRSDSGPTGSFISKTTGINNSDRAQFIPKIRVSPTTPSTVYFGTYRMYRSTNRGDNWSTISPDLTSGSSRSITAFEEAPSDPQVIYVGASGGRVSHTDDAGGTWTNVSAGLPNRFVTDVEIHPTNAARAYITVSGFGSGHVWRTTNSGASWADISGNLPDIPVNALVVDPSDPDTHLYVGTDVGVYRTFDGGTTWIPFSNGLALSAVFDLAFNPTTNSLIAATHGRGIWKGVPAGGGPILTASPTGGFSANGPAGGPLTPTSQIYSITNTGSGTLSWTASENINGMTVSPAAGTLTANQSADVTVTVDSGANTLAAGQTRIGVLSLENTGNGAGNTTRTLTLTTNPPGPANDFFANATALSGSSGTISGTNVAATSESGEPTASGTINSIWYTWTAPSNGTLTTDTNGSNFDTWMAWHTGTSVSSLTFVESDDDDGTGLQSLITRNVTAGVTYRIMIDGFGANTGNVTLNWNFVSSGAATNIVAATAPVGRATTPNVPVTAFATIINAGTATATSCSVALPSGVPATFFYHATTSNGTPTGSQNTPVDIPAGQPQGFFFQVTPTTVTQQNIALIFDCTNTDPAPMFPGVNQFRLISTSAPGADLLMATATAPDFGIMNLSTPSGFGFAAAATVNLGPQSTVTFTPEFEAIGETNVNQPLAVTVCHINPANGACINPMTPGPSATITINQNEVVNLGVFVNGQGIFIPFDIPNNRVYLRASHNGIELAQASVAIRMLSGGPKPSQAEGTSPNAVKKAAVETKH